MDGWRKEDVLFPHSGLLTKSGDSDPCTVWTALRNMVPSLKKKKKKLSLRRKCCLSKLNKTPKVGKPVVTDSRMGTDWMQKALM